MATEKAIIEIEISEAQLQQMGRFQVCSLVQTVTSFGKPANEQDKQDISALSYMYSKECKFHSFITRQYDRIKHWKPY